MVTSTIIRAMAFLKKAFSTDGKSPESLTNALISAKQNAEIIIHIIPLTVLLNSTFLS